MGPIHEGDVDSLLEPEPGYPARLHIPSYPCEARRVQQDIVAALQQLGYGERDIFSITLALEEAFINAIKHGNGMDCAKKVQIAYRIHHEHFEIVIADEG